MTEEDLLIYDERYAMHKELQEENKELQEENKELKKENAELKEKLEKISNYLANDIPYELMNEATNKIWYMV